MRSLNDPFPMKACRAGTRCAGLGLGTGPRLLRRRYVSRAQGHKPCQQNHRKTPQNRHARSVGRSRAAFGSPREFAVRRPREKTCHDQGDLLGHTTMSDSRRTSAIWRLRTRSLPLGERTLCHGRRQHHARLVQRWRSLVPRATGRRSPWTPVARRRRGFARSWRREHQARFAGRGHSGSGAPHRKRRRRTGTTPAGVEGNSQSTSRCCPFNRYVQSPHCPCSPRSRSRGRERCEWLHLGHGNAVRLQRIHSRRPADAHPRPPGGMAYPAAIGSR